MVGAGVFAQRPGQRGWISQSSGASSAPSPWPCPVNKPSGIRSGWRALPRQGLLLSGAGLAGVCLPLSSRGGVGGQVFDWARVCLARESGVLCACVSGGLRVSDRVAVCTRALGWCWSVCTPLANPPHGCAAREAAHPGRPAAAGPASPVPRPFHLSLLLPGLATAPVIMRAGTPRLVQR